MRGPMNIKFVYCQVEVSETGRSLVQSSPSKCAYVIASVQV